MCRKVLPKFQLAAAPEASGCAAGNDAGAAPARRAAVPCRGERAGAPAAGGGGGVGGDPAVWRFAGLAPWPPLGRWSGRLRLAAAGGGGGWRRPSGGGRPWRRCECCPWPPSTPACWARLPLSRGPPCRRPRDVAGSVMGAGDAADADWRRTLPPPLVPYRARLPPGAAKSSHQPARAPSQHPRPGSHSHAASSPPAPCGREGQHRNRRSA